MMGIYAITCVKSGRKYIGASKNLDRRAAHHLSQLRSGRHHNAAMQADFNEYGFEAFRFYVLEQVDALEKLPERELAHMRATTNAYNSVERTTTWSETPETRIIQVTLSREAGKMLKDITQHHFGGHRSGLTVEHLIRAEANRQQRS